ncbi:hypothetical protein C0995_009141 [Termitomyces sp. Mi166|nr:hypothetical protein C0995_009141 [Termitomyces sp. Mi166\
MPRPTHSLPLYALAPDDRPPDYPDSAEEADEDTDSSDASSHLYVPPPPSSFSLTSPRRRRFTSSARRQSGSKNSNSTSTTDPYLDSLLARSVHALEMSNTLLQSSMSTQTALSTIFADSPADDVLENSARGLSMRIEQRDYAQPKWADDLEEIRRGVDGLFADLGEEQAVSCSLPTASSTMKQQAQRHRRRPSMLELGHKDRRPHLVAPPPRTNATLDPSSIYLPSTLSARASVSSLNLPLHAPLSSPKITETLPEPATPAYNMLSSFVVNHQTHASTSTSSTPAARTSPIPALPNFFSNISRRSSASSSSSSRRKQPTIDRLSTSPPTSFKSKSPSTTRASSHEHNRSPSTRTLTPKQIHTSLPHRPMTPPAEESSCGSSSSSSSDAGCLAKRTVLSLRKILDEQPPPPPQPNRPRAPAFMPRTPAPVAQASTSTATASISRLYTKGKHTSSTRPPSPPRQSAMKQPTSPSASNPNSNSKPPSPTTVLQFPGLFSVRNWSSSTSLRSRGSSVPSSGTSTPTLKRISFAELPESYKGETSARFRERGRRRRREKRDNRHKGVGKSGREGEGEGEGGWWSTGTSWFWGAGGGGGGGSGSGGSAREERVEERLGRSWGGRMPGAPVGFGPGMDDLYTENEIALIPKLQTRDNTLLRNYDGGLTSEDLIRHGLHHWDNHVVSLAASSKPSASTRDTSYIEGIASQITRVCDYLVNVFQDLNAYIKFLSYRGQEAQDMLDLLQSLLDCSIINEQIRQMIYVALFRLCRKSELCPRCFNLQDVNIEEYPVTGGGFSEVYKGEYCGIPVCVKVVKVYQTSNCSALHKAFYCEAVLWGQLSHPNILPFYGIHSLGDNRKRISLVSPWMHNGNVRNFLKVKPNINRNTLMSDVADGMLYLHANGVIHGDLKSINILVTELERACIADFGLSYVAHSAGLLHPALSSDHADDGTVGFQAPELVDPEQEIIRKTEASDVFAFAMVCYEIFSGQQPFEGIAMYMVILKIVHGERPARPSETVCLECGLTNPIWAMIEECWSPLPGQRPNFVQISHQLDRTRTMPQSQKHWQASRAPGFKTFIDLDNHLKRFLNDVGSS